MRVALVRGSLLKPWELPNYAIDGVDVDVFASRRVARELEGRTGLDVRGLTSVAETVARLSPRLRGVVDLTAGPLEHLVGLERAVRGYDIVHALELVMPVTHQAVKARDAGACRAVVATVMENIPFTPSPNPIVARRAAACARGVDLFLAITERARLHLQTAGVEDERIAVLPLGIDTDRFAPPEQPERRDDGPLRILCVSRLEVGKGVEDLAIACGLLARRGVDTTVTYVGEGPSRARIEHIAAQMGVADRIRFTGGVSWDALQTVHHEHDVFVLPSAPTRNWREQFGFAVVEAMAAALPVVVGESGSLMEVVGHRTESLVPPHDPIALAERLGALAGDPELRRELGAFNRARAVEHYDERVIRPQLRDAYERALSLASASRSRSPIAVQS